MRTATLYNFLLESNLMASIAIILMIILRKFLRKPLGNSALSFGWLLVAARLLLPLALPNPFIHQIRTPYAPDVAIRPIAGQLKVRFTDLLGSLDRASEGAVKQTMRSMNSGMHDASLPITLAKIYLVGLILVLAWFIFANLRFRRQLNTDKIEPISGNLLAQYEALCKSLKVKPLPVYLIDPLPSACLVGVFRPYIALPLTVTPQDALHVLRHEVSHYQNRDHLFGVLRLLCCAIHWFNPLVWLAASMSYTDAELRCDDRVTASLKPQEKEAYANVLVLSAARRTAPGVAVLATGMTTTTKKLKARVLAILGNKKPLRWLSVAFVLVSTMLLAGAFATMEPVLAPRIGQFSPEVAVQDIKNEEEALAYGKDFFLTRKELGWTPREDLPWKAWKDPSLEDSFVVIARLPDANRETLHVNFNHDGRIVEFSNFDNSWDTAMAIPTTVGKQQLDALAEDLMTFLRLVNPEEAVTANYWTCTQAASGNDLYLEYVFYDLLSDKENQGASTANVSVQISPVVRIVRMNFASGGNG